VYGRPGSYVAGDRLPKDRFLTLTVNIHRRTAEAECTTSELALLANTDAFLDLISQRDGTYLEVVLPDTTTRFTHVVSLDPAPMRQPTARRSFAVPLVAPWGNWWKGGNQNSDAISGADTIVVGGTQPVYDARLVFAGDGTFEHTGLGWEITITGSSGFFSVAVHLGNRTVIEGGLSATALMTRVPVADEGRVWGWFDVGNNAVSASGTTVTVEWRDQWL
jgi:hypothetical protein